MSDEVLESKAAPEVQQEAMAKGWQPPEKYKGPPERFVDADMYLQREAEIMPILRQRNSQLHADVARLAGENSQLSQQMQELTTKLEDMEISQSARTAAEVKRAKEEVRRELAQALKDGEGELAAELTERLGELNEEERAAKTPPKKEEKKEVQRPAVDPALAQWAASHPWYGKDPVKSSTMQGVAAKLRAEGDTTLGIPFLEKCAAEVDQMFTASKKPVDRVEGGRPNGNGSNSTKTGYAALPAEAKQACDMLEKKFVGKGRFKDTAAWQKHYAEEYFRQENR